LTQTTTSHSADKITARSRRERERERERAAIG
jgi:hypothetical protein